MSLLSVFKLGGFPPQNMEKRALFMRQVLPLVKSISSLQLQHLFVIEKLHVFFTSVEYSKSDCQCFSCSVIVLFTKVLAGDMTV